jgi:cytochrome d ubiquinol oxidase subunit I
MNVEILARLQFALTIMFHYIYPVLSIGLSLILVIIEWNYLRTKGICYKDMAKFWTAIFALTFAIGVATGIVMEFEFGTNWATYSRYVGDVFGSALAAEGVFAFFLESGFLAILLFGWDRVGPKMHFFSTLMVCLGAHFSAIWIVVANSWMQTPAGYHIVGEGLNARAEITDFWAMVFNPSSMDRLAHVIIGAWLAGAFFVISISAYYLLKKQHIPFAKYSLKIALTVSTFSIVLQGISGHSSAQGVAVNQPAKLAAFEGIYHTQRDLSLSLFGLPNSQKEELEYRIEIPHLLSYLTVGDLSTEVQGLDQYPKADWPHVPVVFQTYHLMITMWSVMLALSLSALWLWWRGTLFESRWLLRLLVPSMLFPQIANQAGWVSAEMGRYPWIVQGHLRISEGLSKAVTANQVFGSIVMFGVVYALLFILFTYLLSEKIRHGPSHAASAESYYHQQNIIIEELTHDSQSR